MTEATAKRTEGRPPRLPARLGGRVMAAACLAVSLLVPAALPAVEKVPSAAFDPAIDEASFREFLQPRRDPPAPSPGVAGRPFFPLDEARRLIADPTTLPGGATLSSRQGKLLRQALEGLLAGGSPAAAVEPIDRLIADLDSAVATVVVRYWQAEARLAAAQWREARDSFSSVAAGGVFPVDGLAAAMLGWMHLRDGDAERAAIILGAARERLQPGEWRDGVTRLLGRLRFDRGEYAEAAALFQEVRDGLAEPPGEVLLLLGEARLRSGSASQARISFDAYRRRFPGDRREGEVIEAMAWCDLIAGNFDAAAEGFQMAAGRLEDDRAQRARFLAGVSAELAGRPVEASSMYQEAARGTRDAMLGARALSRMAMIERQAGRHAEAAALLEQAANRIPGTEPGWLARYLAGAAMIAAGDLAAASRIFLDLAGAATVPDLGARAMLAAGWCRHRLGLDDEAVSILRKLLVSFRDHPGTGEATFWLGEAYAAAGNLTQADFFFGRAADGGRRTAEALYGRGWVQRRSENWSLAAKYFGQVVERFPMSPQAADAAYRRGESRFAAGEWAVARAAIELFLEKFPGDPAAPDALWRAGHASLKLESLSSALDFFRRLEEGWPGRYSREAAYQQGWILLRQGEYSAALGRLERLAVSPVEDGWTTRALAGAIDAAWELEDWKRVEENAAKLTSRLPADHPDLPGVLTARIGALIRLQARDEARTLLATFMERFPRHGLLPPLLEGAAGLEEAGGSPEAAEGYLRRLIEWYAGDEFEAKARLDLARVIRRDRPDEAIRLLEEAGTLAAQTPLEERVLFDLGVLRRDTGDCIGARGVFRRHLDAFPGSPRRAEVLHEDALCARVSGDHEGERKDLTVLLENYPDYPAAPERALELAGYLLGEGDVPVARVRVELARRRGLPEQVAAAQYLLASLLLAEGERDRAAMEFLAVPTLYPESRPAHPARLAAAVLFLEAGDRDQGARILAEGEKPGAPEWFRDAANRLRQMAGLTVPGTPGGNTAPIDSPAGPVTPAPESSPAP